MAEGNILVPSFEGTLNKGKETVGAAARRLLMNKDTKQGIVDTEREINKDYFDQCRKCVERKPHSDWTMPWFLIVLNKKERLLENVVRRYFFGRKTLPTPEYDQTVWYYTPSTGDLRYLWTVPDKNTCLWMYNNPSEIPYEQTQLAKNVFDFMENRLYSQFSAKI